MKEIHGKTLYACGYCGKKFQMKHTCLYHEEHKCTKNPNNQHKCFDNCKYLTYIEETETLYNYIGQESYFTFKTFRCLHKDIEMYSFRLSNKHSLKPFIGGIRMPLECECYEKKNEDLFY